MQYCVEDSAEINAESQFFYILYLKDFLPKKYFYNKKINGQSRGGEKEIWIV